MSDFRPLMHDDLKLRLDERLAASTRAPRLPRPHRRHRLAEQLRSVASRLDS